MATRRVRKAAKDHICFGCRNIIAKGEQYLDVIHNDGFERFKHHDRYHLACDPDAVKAPRPAINPESYQSEYMKYISGSFPVIDEMSFFTKQMLDSVRLRTRVPPIMFMTRQQDIDVMLATNLHQKETNTMKNMTIKTVHLVNGRDVTTMTTEEQIALIADTEAQIKELKGIKVTCTTVTTELEKCKVFLKDIVALFDKE